MISKLIYSGVISLLLFGCSTGPELERDNVFDPKADVPNAKFISPLNNSERGPVEYESFRLLVNGAVKNSDVTVTLESDQDGNIYSSTNIASDTVTIDFTKLSSGYHEIKLLLDGQETDKRNLNVSLPSSVKLHEPTWSRGGYSITWSEYVGPGFQKYEVWAKFDSNVRFLDQWGTINIPIKTITNIADTALTDYLYPIQSEFEYYVKTFSSDTDKQNVSNYQKVTTTLLNKQEDEIELYNTFIAKIHNEVIIYYPEWETIGEVEATLWSYNLNRNEKSINFSNEIHISEIYLNRKVNPKELLIALENGYVYKYDINNFNLLNEYNLYPVTEQEIDHILYDENISAYFTIADFYGPVVFDNEFNLLDKDGITRVHQLFAINKESRVLFGQRSFSPNKLMAFSYDQNGSITGESETARYNTAAFGVVSQKYNLLIYGNRGEKFSADVNLDPKGSLPDVQGYYVDYAILENDSDTLYALATDPDYGAQPKSYLYKIYLPENRILFEKAFKYEIKNMYQLDGEIYLLQSADNQYGEQFRFTPFK